LDWLVARISLLAAPVETVADDRGWALVITRVDVVSRCARDGARHRRNVEMGVLGDLFGLFGEGRADGLGDGMCTGADVVAREALSFEFGLDVSEERPRRGDERFESDAVDGCVVVDCSGVGAERVTRVEVAVPARCGWTRDRSESVASREATERSYSSSRSFQ
jgi:hypothetical protein